MFRRQALDRGAHLLTVDHVVTGHNADDVAETVLMNGVALTNHSLAILADAVSPQCSVATYRAWNGVQPSQRAATVRLHNPTQTRT